MKRYISIILIIVLVLLTGCSNEDAVNNSDGKLVVYASFYPQYYLAKEIGKDKISLDCIVPIGAEPHDFEPTIKQIKNIQQGDIFIYNGANMEHWIDKLLETIDKDQIVAINSSKYVDLIKVDGSVDPHIWLNPMNMDKIAYEIKETFALKDPKNKEFYEKNYVELSKKLNVLDEKYRNTLEEKKSDTILVSHYAFSYMADRYGFKQISVAGLSPEEEPSPKTIAKLIDVARNENLEYIFLETLTNPKASKMIAEEANLKILTLNPIGGLTEEEQKNGEDYISIMEKNLDNLKKALVD